MSLPRKPRVLITGGAGFIGSYLCERYLQNGWEVICIDNFYTGQKENIKHLLNRLEFELIRHDVVEPLLLEVDLVLNFACPASPIHYQNNPIKTVKTNVLGTLNALGLAKRVGARFLQASTSEIYGDPLTHPQSEDYWGNVNPIGIRSCYDEGKRLAETLCYDYHREHGLDVRVARIFNTYGPRMAIDDGRVVSNFIVQALQNRELTVHGDGSQTRSFCYVDDLVEGIFLLSTVEQNQLRGPVNLGNSDEFTVLQLAKEVLNQTQSSSSLVHLELPQDDPKIRCPDLTYAKKLLNWQPKTNLVQGISQSIPYFRQKLGLTL